MIKNSSKFAIVDLETSDAFSNGGKIIEIAITMVENWKITGSYNSFVNPGRHIPDRISELTNIYDTDVVDAPYFEEIADNIFNKLKDTVFVGHNVNFDFNFLNGEFKRNKHKTLNISRIDTLALSQIIYPTFEKHNLAQLSTDLGILLNHNHLAKFDALATAQLFIKMFEKANDFPFETIKAIRKLNLNLMGNSEQFFHILEGKKIPDKTKYLKKNSFFINKNLSIPKHLKKQVNVDDIGLSTDLRITKKQLELGDVLFSSTKNFTNIITKSRFGKTNTILYLSVLNFLNNKKTLIVAENQHSIRHIFKKWHDVFQNYVSGELLSEYPTSKDFVDLNLFQKKLKLFEEKNIQIIKARILVWLLETKYGNFLEFKAADMEDINNKIGISTELNPLYARFIKEFIATEISIVEMDGVGQIDLELFDTLIFSGKIDVLEIKKIISNTNKRAILITKDDNLKKPFKIIM
ncbi:MAG: hypothetical protein LBC17_04365 [Lactobacillaceae bacterium]|nr:hypothetical protein [Lactobacillaceae bacterium]